MSSERRKNPTPQKVNPSSEPEKSTSSDEIGKDWAASITSRPDEPGAGQKHVDAPKPAESKKPRDWSHVVFWAREEAVFKSIPANPETFSLDWMQADWIGDDRKRSEAVTIQNKTQVVFYFAKVERGEWFTSLWES